MATSLGRSPSLYVHFDSLPIPSVHFERLQELHFFFVRPSACICKLTLLLALTFPDNVSAVRNSVGYATLPALATKVICNCMDVVL